MWSFYVLYFSFFSTLVAGVFGRWLGVRGTAFTTIFFLFLSFIFSIFSLRTVFFGGKVYYLELFNWFFMDSFSVNFSFLFDSLSVTMLFVVTFISFLVHLYSYSYMGEDPHFPRFIFYLSLFTFFMLLLVSSANLLQFFVGWEGIGISSYLLIGFWYTRFQASQAAFKALLVNRVGDAAFVTVICLCYYYFQTLDFSTLYFLSSDFDKFNFSFFGFPFAFSTLVAFFVVTSAMSKSSQIGLHTWLPDAMEGPTPVSALIHAATLVTAGVFAIIRFSFIIEKSEFVLNFMVVLGVLTALLGSTIGLFQYDLKKVIAYSTCSQLGYMVLACGLSSYDLAIFHLFNHAFFKALLFLGAGSVIHAVSDEQDMRKMGGLLSFLPFTHVSMFFGTLALVGFPFFSGFYSKDLIIETAFYFPFSFPYWFSVIAVFFSSFYSFRLLYYVFYSSPRAAKTIYLSVHEAPVPMFLALFSLCFPTIFIGYLFLDYSVGLATDYWSFSIYIDPLHYFRYDAEFSFFYFKQITLCLTFVGLISSLLIHSKVPDYFFFSLFFYYEFTPFFVFFNKKWFFDQFYNQFFVKVAAMFGYQNILNSFDRGVVEKVFVVAPLKTSKSLALFFADLQSGYIFQYVFLFTLGLTFFLFILFFPYAYFLQFTFFLVSFYFAFYSFLKERPNP